MLQRLDSLHIGVAVDDQVSSECVLGRTDSPDMDMMAVFNIFHAADRLSHLFDFNACRDAIQGEAQAIPQQLPGAEEDDDGYGEAEDGVYPIKACIEDHDA